MAAELRAQQSKPAATPEEARAANAALREAMRERGNYFEVMGLSPVLGRLTNSRDDGPAAAPVAVLSHQFWMEKFGGDPKVIGKTVRINDMVSTLQTDFNEGAD